MVLTINQQNMEYNACAILAPSNVPITPVLEPDGDKQHTKSLETEYTG